MGRGAPSPFFEHGPEHEPCPLRAGLRDWPSCAPRAARSGLSPSLSVHWFFPAAVHLGRTRTPRARLCRRSLCRRSPTTSCGSSPCSTRHPRGHDALARCSRKRRACSYIRAVSTATSVATHRRRGRTSRCTSRRSYGARRIGASSAWSAGAAIKIATSSSREFPVRPIGAYPRAPWRGLTAPPRSCANSSPIESATVGAAWRRSSIMWVTMRSWRGGGHRAPIGRPRPGHSRSLRR
jgi:hypothetical protein